jgi:transposase InsO family protein
MTSKKLSARQARWAEFLSQFYFLIKYQAGRMNVIADILSRKDEKSNKTESRTQVLLRPKMVEPAITTMETDQPDQPPQGAEEPILDRIRRANRTDISLEDNRKKAREGDSDWRLTASGLLTYRGLMVVPTEGENADLRGQLLNEVHRQASIAHPGTAKTSRLIKQRYYWSTWRKDVVSYVQNCLKCRRAENPRDKKPGLLQPLPIPDRPWQHIAMDFRSMPRDRKGYDSVFVIVDRFCKKPVSIPCLKTIDSRGMAQLFLEHVYRHHGAPDSIVSDRGPQFISSFWNEFCRILGIKLKLSTAHHPQTDGQTEIVNQHIAMRLRPLISHYQDDWSDLLPMIDHAAMTVHQESIGASPCFVEKGYEPRTSFDWTEENRPLKDIDRQAAVERARKLEEIWEAAKGKISRVQEAQSAQANKHRREVDFLVGDRVYLSLRSYRTNRPSRKLDDQQAGPFRIVERVGNSYRLELPPSMKIHPVISPDKLRRATDNEPIPGQYDDPPPPVDIDGEDEWEVEDIVAVRPFHRKLQYRVKWVGHDDDPAWYPAANLKNCPVKLRLFHDRYPDEPGPPKRLSEWLAAADKDEIDDDHPDDNLPDNAKTSNRSGRAIPKGGVM